MVYFPTEYPNGTYAYFATVDENWNSVYPYAIGPTFYGQYQNRSVNSVDENTTVYEKSASIDAKAKMEIQIFPNPSAELIAVQTKGLNLNTLSVHMLSINGEEVYKGQINSGQTLSYISTEALYSGMYILVVRSNKDILLQEKVKVVR